MTTLILSLLLALIAGPAEEIVAFVGVSVIPMDTEQVLLDQTVIVRGDRITLVGPRDQVEIPEGARIIAGEGRFLIPGLAEMHGHIPPPTQPPAEIEKTLFLYLANGITTVRGMLGHPGQLELRERANASELDSPNLYLAGPSFNGGSISSPSQAAARVRSQIEEGWDLLKVHPGLTLAEYDSMAAAAHRGGIAFGGHVPAEVGLDHAIRMEQLTFDHLDGYVQRLFEVDPEAVDLVALDELVRNTVAAGAWVVPTLVLWETIFSANDLDELNDYPELIYMPPSTVATWDRQFRARLTAASFDLNEARKLIDARMQVLAALNDGGAGILMGTDAPQQYSVPGFSLHREMARMVEAGMSPYQVLKSGTANVGRYFEDKDTFGIVGAGHRADLLLLEANPLDDVANVASRAGVMVRGRWIPEQEIQQRLGEIAASYR